MKKLALVLALAFAASLSFAQPVSSPAFAPAASPARQTPAKSACVPVLQAQMQEDTTATLEWKSIQYKAGLKQGLALGAAAMLAFVGIVFEIKKHRQPTSSAARPISRAASA